MVLAGISMQGKRTIISFKTANWQLHDTSILDMYVPLYDGAMDPDFILMDNACTPRARVTNEYLQTATIEGMDRPVWSVTLIQLNMPGTCCRLQYLPAQSSQLSFNSSNRHYCISGFESFNKAFEGKLEGDAEQ